MDGSNGWLGFSFVRKCGHFPFQTAPPSNVLSVCRRGEAEHMRDVCMCRGWGVGVAVEAPVHPATWHIPGITLGDSHGSGPLCP